MGKIAIVIHGGAGPDSAFIKQNKERYEEGLKQAVVSGYQVLKTGGTAVAAVEKAVQSLEDNGIFNAGHGCALNNKGEVEMDAAIMNGENLKAGAVSMVRNVKNPISLARLVLEKTNHVLISGYGAMEFAADENVPLETDSYFISEHSRDEYLEERNQQSIQEMLRKRIHGTVGAVAVDAKGNVASATSTGGIPNSLPGRIGDSCIIGSGCFANNNTCAVSSTGDGEFIMTSVVAHSVSMSTEIMKGSLQEICDHVIHERNKGTEGQMGVIAVNANADIGISFNSPRMHRAWIDADGKLGGSIY
ncbi:MAG: Beta-aspartyl-peptidase [Pedobacter sp.]|jgi:beta-aspartyl-peptidase (threonine type)|nr:Beta-aspartyl-peptidase [Pedobacter sp.]